MSIIFHEKSKIFHLHNDSISYIMMILENGHLGQLYCGKRIHDREDFSYLLEKAPRPMSSCVYEDDKTFSLEHIRQEMPVYGTTDYRHPAVEVLQDDTPETLQRRVMEEAGECQPYFGIWISGA